MNQEKYKVKVKKLNDNAVLPKFADNGSAGMDLYCLESYEIAPHSTVKVGTGIAMEIPYGYMGGVFARSGLATKKDLRPANCVGVIDSSYRGEIIVALHNDSDELKTVNAFDRVAQLLLIPCLMKDSFELGEVCELSETERGDGGFGHSGE